MALPKETLLPLVSMVPPPLRKPRVRVERSKLEPVANWKMPLLKLRTLAVLPRLVVAFVVESVLPLVMVTEAPVPPKVLAPESRIRPPPPMMRLETTESRLLMTPVVKSASPPLTA